MKPRRRAASSAVIDSSCLIFLLHLDKNTEDHSLIRSLSFRYSRIYIPNHVVHEVNRKHRSRYDLNRLMRRYTFLSRCRVTDETRVMMLADARAESSTRIDQGEA